MTDAPVDLAATPTYRHDSTCCRFLEHSYEHDWYLCERSLIPSLGYAVLARYGNEGREYWCARSEWLGREPIGYGLLYPDNVPITSLVHVWAHRVLRRHEVIA